MDINVCLCYTRLHVLVLDSCILINYLDANICHVICDICIVNSGTFMLVSSESLIAVMMDHD